MSMWYAFVGFFFLEANYTIVRKVDPPIGDSAFMACWAQHASPLKVDLPSVGANPAQANIPGGVR